MRALSDRVPLTRIIRTFSQSRRQNFPILRRNQLINVIARDSLNRTATRDLSPCLALTSVVAPRPIAITPSTALPRILRLLGHLGLDHLPIARNGGLMNVVAQTSVVQTRSSRIDNSLPRLNPRTRPSCMILRRQTPTANRKQLLIPLSSPRATPSLVGVTTTVTRKLRCRLRYIRIVQIPHDITPTRTEMSLRAMRPLQRLTLSCTSRDNLSIRFRIQTTRRMKHALLRVVHSHRVSLILVN